MKKISFCIPVFNQDVRPLLQSILRQIAIYNKHNQTLTNPDNTFYRFQIFVLDDASTDKSEALNNEAFCKTQDIGFYKNDENLGRSKTRNRFLKLSDGDWLLFLDGDSMPVDDRFLQRYLDALDADIAKMIYGGTKYSVEQPEQQFLLHWKYGHHAEALSAARRNQIPVMSFHSNNFLIDRELFTANPFHEGISGYGHEDSVLAIELAKKGIQILHIENPVYHLGLSTNAAFLAKTRQAIENLPLAARLLGDGTLEKYNKLWRTYIKYKVFVPRWIARFWYWLFSILLEKRFVRGYYNSRLLSFFKLLYLLALRRG